MIVLPICIQINIYFDKYKIKNEKFKKSAFNFPQKFIKLLIMYSIISNSLKNFQNSVDSISQNNPQKNYFHTRLI